MENISRPLTIHSWPKAIAHVDADAFFASCEQAVNPELKGKPVITGKERGIVAAASYEAKAKGVKRAVNLFQAKKVCPDLIMLPSDYEIYSLFSVRMFEIFRRFSPDVEEYSIDEAFIDLTGLRRSFHGSYRSIARKIQTTVEKELDITVSIGLSVSKVLAKIASKHKKPKGLTAIPGREIHRYLADLPVDKVWGIGANTAAHLRKLGQNTALKFSQKDEEFVKKHFTKPHIEIWHELNGRSIYPVTTEERSGYKSISKVKTFTPPSNDKSFIFAQISKNLENACIKARRHNLAATRLIILLRRKDFKDTGVEIKLTRPTAYPTELFEPLRKGFIKTYNPNIFYRSTGVVLAELMPIGSIQRGLFDDGTRIEGMRKIYMAVDKISKRFGKHTLQHCSSLPAKLQAQHEGKRGDIPNRKTELFSGENKRQRLGMPLITINI